MSPINSFISLVKDDIAVPLFLICIIFLMILPLPTWMVDSFIALNMTVGVLLLMTAVRLQNPLDFSIFPSILLISTVFRLALSITTTRLILLNGDAGEIIKVFGNFVVGGNIIVGLVIFLIITIVQFLVITKGAERVAEVSARFSLDGMPGKQMSIDSDMRSGTIDIDEARKRREIVSKESQLYGSMDGAMKFVKGDAIAGLIITAVNILGGIAIGVLQHNISAGEALAIYTVLTIGDGLISQIPALFIAIAAGIIVTRVTDEDKNVLGQDIVIQLLNKPHTTSLVSIIMLGFAFIPGFPTHIFILISISLMAYTWYFFINNNFSTKKAKSKTNTDGFSTDHLDISEENKNSNFILTVPLIVEVSTQLERYIDIDDLNTELSNIRYALLIDLGVPFPMIELRYSYNISEEEYVISIHESPISKASLVPGGLCVKNQEDSLKVLNIPYSKTLPFTKKDILCWVDVTHQKKLIDNKVSYLNTQQFLAYHICFILKKHVREFLGLQETIYILDQINEEYSELVKELNRALPLQRTTQILQRLVAEGVSIRNMRAIMSSLIEWSQNEKDPLLLSEYVRVDLSRQICNMYVNENHVLPVYIIDQEIERIVREGVRQSSMGSYLAIEPEKTAKIIEAVSAKILPHLSGGETPIVMTSLDIRRYIKKMLEKEFHEVAVLSFQEVNPEINVQPIDQISLA